MGTIPGGVWAKSHSFTSVIDLLSEKKHVLLV